MPSNLTEKLKTITTAKKAKCTECLQLQDCSFFMSIKHWNIMRRMLVKNKRQIAHKTERQACIDAFKYRTTFTNHAISVSQN